MCNFPCQICGVFMPSTHRRYGGACCSSCATFFQRSIKLQESFSCPNDNNCLKEPSRANAKCQKCRFKRCLEIGMISRELIQYNETKIELEKAADGECAVFALITETILKTAFKLTPLLEKYFNDGDLLFYLISIEVAKDEKMDLSQKRIQKLTILLNKFPVTAEELLTFYQICTCKLEFPHFSEAEKLRMKELQMIALQKLAAASTENINRFYELINISVNFVNIFAENTETPPTSATK